ncbi:hypothetical protein C8T65DRAFT_653590 [Cerioporus squamosus]|nr:hypothetical protein C8T65DRAFT_653590 [Cerioporus squamosus]
MSTPHEVVPTSSWRWISLSYLLNAPSRKIWTRQRSLRNTHIGASMPCYIDIYARRRDVGYGMFIPIAFVAWDYIVTLDREVDLFWLRRRTTGSILFFANRYFHPDVQLPCKNTGLSEAGYTPDCKFLRDIAGLSYFPFVPWAVFSGIRAYALSKRLLVSTLICLLSLIPPVVHFCLYFRGNAGVFLPIHECSDSMSTAIALVVLTVSRAAMVLADFLLIVVTVSSLRRCPVRERLAGVKHMTFSSILLWNGTILLVLNALDLRLSLAAIFDKHDRDNTSLTVFASPITAILVSHFLLDLQEANQRSLKLGTEDISSPDLHHHNEQHPALSLAQELEVSPFGAIISTLDDATGELAGVEESTEGVALARRASVADEGSVAPIPRVHEMTGHMQ